MGKGTYWYSHTTLLNKLNCIKKKKKTWPNPVAFRSDFSTVKNIPHILMTSETGKFFFMAQNKVI